MDVQAIISEADGICGPRCFLGDPEVFQQEKRKQTYTAAAASPVVTSMAAAMTRTPGDMAKLSAHSGRVDVRLAHDSGQRGVMISRHHVLLR